PRPTSPKFHAQNDACTAAPSRTTATGPSSGSDDRWSGRACDIGGVKKPEVDLNAIVRHYISRHRPRVEAEFAAIRAEPSLEAVIQRAGRAETAAGRRDPHHTRRPQNLLER